MGGPAHRPHRDRVAPRRRPDRAARRHQPRAPGQRSAAARHRQDDRRRHHGLRPLRPHPVRQPRRGRIFGFAHRAIIGRSFFDLLPEPHRRNHREALDRFLATGDAPLLGERREVAGRRPDGSVFPMDVTITELHTTEGRRFMAVVADVSQRRLVDRLKGEFLSTVNHELRTPLTSIIGSLELLKDGLAGPLEPRAQRFADLAYENSERLLRIVNDILDMERLGSGHVELNRRPSTRWSSSRRPSPCTKAGRAPPGHPGRRVGPGPGRSAGRPRPPDAGACEPHQQRRALLAPDGTVTIGVDEQDGEALFWVQDQGPGIPRPSASRSSCRSRRPTAARQPPRRRHGPGPVHRPGHRRSPQRRHLVRHGGGRGHHLPVPRAAARLAGHRRGAHGRRQARRGHLLARLRGVAMTLPPHILHVDDDDDIRGSSPWCSRDGGVRVTTAPPAVSRRWTPCGPTSAPDMVLLDVMMPGMDGPAVLSRIRQDPGLAALPVVFLTAKSLRQDRERLRALGAIDIIEKPFRANELIERLRGIWAGR
ncbi:MAG: response regulator [Alphaproteobacteria bacterium]|nr:response regulator [Alphaproteobacteria bacterium]